MEKFLYPKTFEVITNSTENLNSFCDTFVYEPENFEEEKLGFLYLIGQIVSKNEEKSQAAYLLNLIATQTAQSFYKKISFASKEAFEKTALEINRLVRELIEQDKLVWLKRINLALVLLVPQSGELCFAILGEAQGFLWRRGQMMDITKDFIDHGPQIFSEKLFKNIATGSIEFGDKLILSAPLLTDKIKLQALKILTDDIQHTGFETFKEKLNLKNDDMALIVLDIGNERPIFTRSKITKKETLAVSEKISEKYPKTSFVFFKNAFRKAALHLPKFFKKTSVVSPKKIIDKLYDKEKLAFLDKPVVIKKPKFRFPFSRFPRIKLPPISKKWRLLSFSLAGIIIFVLIIVLLVKSHPKTPKIIFDADTTVIENPLPYLDLSEYTLSFDALGLINQNKQFIFYDKSSFYVFDNTIKKGTFIFPELNASSSISFASILGSNLAFLAPKGEIIVLKDNLKDYEIKKLARTSDTPIMDIANFENNLYLLLESGKIIKYTNFNFSKSSPWLSPSDPAEQNPISFTIDTNIYVLEKSGAIYQYEKGKRIINYSIPVPGAVALGDKVLTYPEFKNIYLLSRSQNEIMIFDKTTQKLIKKLASSLWQNMTALSVSPDEKTIYLLNGAKVYEIKI